MPANISEIEFLSRESEKAKKELTQLFRNFGYVSYKWHNSIAWQPSNKTFEEITEILYEHNDVSSRIATLQEAMEKMKVSDKKIEQSKLSMKELDKRYSVLIASLGAVAIEIEAAGNLPQRLVRFVSPMKDYEKKLAKVQDFKETAKKTGSKFLLSISLLKEKKIKGTLDDVFRLTGKKIYNSGEFRDVPGKRAAIILSEMEQIRNRKKNYKKEIKTHESEITQTQGSLESLGALGEEKRKLNVLEAQRAELDDKLNEGFARYGEILDEGLENWFDNDAPQELVACATAIKNCKKKLEKINLNIEVLEIGTEIRSSEAKIGQFNNQLRYINSQIEVFSAQKKEVLSKIDSEQKANTSRLLKRSEISGKIKELK